MKTETTRFENLYHWMKKNNELKSISTKLTGDWEKDKDKFIILQKEMEDMANLTDIDLD